MDTPVPDADWLYRCAVLFVPVGDVRIGCIKSAVDRGQSTDALPVTESLVLYTFLCLYDYCAAGYTRSWTFCDTVFENLCAQEQLLRRGVLPVYRTMEGAVWKGTPQDCMEHLRNGHNVPWISRTASIERFVPPWTVRRELWTESLRPEHSGMSTDIMLLSDLGLSLTHHYRVYRGGLPHAAFRTDYMTRLRALLPTPPSMNGEPASPPETV